MNIKKILSKYIYNAMIQASIPDSYNVVLRKCKQVTFGHYQVNGIITAANKLKLNPKHLAIKVIKNINNIDIIKKMEVSQFGHINIFINEIWLSKQMNMILISSTLGFNKKIKIKNIVVDYSGPNIAKEMHVGHLRSTVLGDAIVRILTFVGHNVIPVNHIGDWGTQFGMLIAFLTIYKQNINKELSISNLDILYQQAQKKYINDINFAKKSRNYVVKLQNQDPFCLKIWKKLINITMENNYQLYNTLNILLNSAHTMGESTYNNMLPDIINDLQKKGLAIISNGAVIIPIKYNDLISDNIIIIKKSDGAYLYATTDIACIKYRAEYLHADRIIYYIDARQSQYLKNIFYIVKKAKYVKKNVQLEHHVFGMILNKNSKPYKTREGHNIKLQYLINEAISRSKTIILNKQPNIKQHKLNNLAQIIGVGAIKYNDLSKNRMSNYIFNWNEILNFEGNTSLYIQYAYVRAISILNKSNMSIKNIKDYTIIFTNQNEINLAILFLEFEEIILQVIEKGLPHILCNWLYKIAVLFSTFYENCNILNNTNNNTKISRLKIIFITSQFLKKGLNMLGIQTIQNM
ncbi:arginine--tRNA ligase [Enterobacteriaceae endosymbiont of Neohaemonia nigricornis]|uniref:arginine--tRNA ligase n=1 Tax=Enterobacteriaceae endosymbiont of Neohaemonia nigricornis TaxID=2675792 RepID=UPI001449A65A|nr:arginine--tRNA ligase [Enterobacteriaceae endosymbiont of Neohaemonia nigricornis]QJC30591.1 arginine--tRNA ligase [Enterobacteriaceae endosymbiont of Neohaemonia nigricornis]